MPREQTRRLLKGRPQSLIQDLLSSAASHYDWIEPSNNTFFSLNWRAHVGPWMHGWRGGGIVAELKQIPFICKLVKLFWANRSPAKGRLPDHLHLQRMHVGSVQTSVWKQRGRGQSHGVQSHSLPPLMQRTETRLLKMAIVYYLFKIPSPERFLVQKAANISM